MVIILVTTHLLKMILGQDCNDTDNDMMDGLPTASSNNANDASRLDFSMTVQLKSLENLLML